MRAHLIILFFEAKRQENRYPVDVISVIIQLNIFSMHHTASLTNRFFPGTPIIFDLTKNIYFVILSAKLEFCRQYLMDDNNDLPKNSYKVPAVEQAIRVMLCLAESGRNPVSLTDICREVGIHRSKAFSILNTLSEYDLVKKNPNRKGYVLGPGLLTLTGKMLETLSLSRLVEPILYDLAKKAGATVALGVISDDKTFVVAQYEGAPGIGISSAIGHVTPVTYGAHGKAIAAFLPENELEELLKNKELYFHGSPQKFSRSRLKKELAQCRRTGYALELGDMQQGVNAVAAPILDQNNRPVAYVTIVGFFSRERALKLGALAAGAVKIISRESGHLIFWERVNNQRKITQV
jgi:DNA-binding IclR family transcriptional regulator